MHNYHSIVHKTTRKSALLLWLDERLVNNTVLWKWT